MRLRPESFAMTVVLALLTGMGPISTDLYVPSMPQLAQDLGVTPGQTQWTMSGFLFGFAVGQLFYGPASDSIGRKPVLLTGFVIFLIASAASALAQSIEMLTAARFLQGLGGACPIIIARAMVRDLYDGPRAGKQLATMSTIMGLAPILSPLAGGLLAIWFGWRASFVAMFVAVGALTVVAATLLPETLRTRSGRMVSPGEILASFRIVARSKSWRVYAILMTCCHTGLFTFISSSPFILRGVYGLNPFQFGLGFSICSAAFLAGAAAGGRLVARLGLDGVIGIGVALLAGGGVLQLVAWKLAPHTSLSLYGSEAFFFCGVGLTLPSAVAASLAPFPERAGAATSLAGFIQMVVSALFGLFIASLIAGSAAPLVIATLATGAVAAATFLLSARIRRARS